MDKVEEPDISLQSESKARTPAYAIFDSNTDKLSHLFRFLIRGVDSFGDEIRSNIAEISNLINRKQDKEESNEQTERITHIMGGVQKIKEIVEPLTGGLTTMQQWIPVMLVTSVEAYLKDVLIYTANIHPAIMESSEQSASYSEVTKAQSLKELKEELQSRWARNFVDDGGPERWIKKLNKMGARGYRSQSANEMETLWGVRHLVVHSAGIANLEFIRRHSEIGAKAGESIRIYQDQLKKWIALVYHFVDVTDFYFVQRNGPSAVSAIDTK